MTKDELGFVIEKPDSMPSAPQYLSAEGNENTRRFFWTDLHIHALRFARKEDAEQIAAISRTAQPDLWRGPDIGRPRIHEHMWSAPPDLGATTVPREGK